MTTFTRFFRNKSFVFLALIALSAQIAPAEIFAGEARPEETSSLATASPFDTSKPDSRSPEFTKSLLSDFKLMTAVLSIGKHYIVNNRDSRTLPRMMRDEFRTDPTFIEGVDLEQVSRHENIVTVPYRRGDDEYRIRIASRDFAERFATDTSQWGLTERFAVQIVRVSAPANVAAPGRTDARATKSGSFQAQRVSQAMEQDNWMYLRDRLREGMGQVAAEPDYLKDFFSTCENATFSAPNHPVEGRYPLLRAVTQLTAEEKVELLRLLGTEEFSFLRRLTVVDAVVLMLAKEAPGDWAEHWAAELKGRTIWQVSSEIWYPAGGLGRVMQYHSIAMSELLKDSGVGMAHIEPLYHARRNAQGAIIPVDLDYYRSFPSEIRDIREIDRFQVKIGSVDTWAVVYRGVNKYGIEVNFIGDTGKNAGAEGASPYYTKMMYNYQTADNPVSWEEFTAFFSYASTELIRRSEAKRRDAAPAAWKAPVVHTNDAQLSLVDIYRDMIAQEHPDDEVVRDMNVFFTTHTYPNRSTFGRRYGEGVLSRAGIPSRYWRYFMRDHSNTVDFTSAAIRWAHEHKNWTGAVSAQHADDVVGIDKWGDWSDLDLVAVTNGDQRSFTAEFFRKTMLELFPDADVEHPTPAQVLATKRQSKIELGLDPDQYVISYSGRLVPEKIGRGWELGRPDDRDRAFHDANIEAWVKAGLQVVIYGNVQDNDQSREIEHELKVLEARLKGVGPGRFIFVPRFDINDQRKLLAATDIQIQDSDGMTEAAGYSEADVAVCGGLQCAPPTSRNGGRNEGILQKQGAPINLNVSGEGNTLVPENDHYMTYRNLILDVTKKKPEELAQYQANSIRFSRVLEARNTSAEYLRQWNEAIVRKTSSGDARRTMAGVVPEESAREKEPDAIAMVRKAMDDIHSIDVALRSPIPDGKILWHVIPVNLIPQGVEYNQRARFIELVSQMNRLYPDSRERIKIVTEQQECGAIVSQLAADPKNIVDVALDDESQIDAMADGVRMLVFKPLGGELGDFRQLEGIIASLRALHITDRATRNERLGRLFRLLTGADAVIPDTDDPKAFAKSLVFILPPIVIEAYETLRQLNESLALLLEAA